MGSSAKKKKEKKQDFQKAKLKVGKARPKNTNATDTSFSAKSIVLKSNISHENRWGILSDKIERRGTVLRFLNLVSIEAMPDYESFDSRNVNKVRRKRTLIPKLLMAMTYGEAAAVPAPSPLMTSFNVGSL